MQYVYGVLALAAALVYYYVRGLKQKLADKGAQVDSLNGRIDAQEAEAARQRSEERAKDAKEAESARTSGRAAADFLRNS